MRISSLIYFVRKEEISVHDGCLLRGSRVVVPLKGRTDVLNLLHETQSGMSRMKSLARSHVLWPGLDKRIEEKAKKFPTCQVHQKMPPRMSLHPWEWPRIGPESILIMQVPLRAKCFFR